MKGIKLKILFVLLMLVPFPFSCRDKNECLDLEREPYFSMQDMVFKYVDLYWRNQKTGKLMFDTLSQDFKNTIYPCDSLSMYFEAPDTALMFHSQLNTKFSFGFTQDVFACNGKRNGWAGTLEKVDKIFISSNYDFDEMHNKDDNLSDIVDIFAYTTNGKNSWMQLDQYNEQSPYEAPKRFHLLVKRKPTRSNVQQFVIKYFFENEPGQESKYFIITTPVFHVR